ncbi:MAG: DUF3501 family protein [Deltaproteobacteria bacterium]|nr:DUF3501 family protein [Deltaproteobacteria bacterium]
MRTVTADELLPLGAYEAVRDRFRARIIAHKRARRVLLGAEMSFLFEDHDTVLSQVQEMLRAERISSAAGVRDELEAYNDLVPEDGCLKGTLMIEVEDPETRERRRRELVGLDDALWLELGGHRCPGEFDALGRFEDRTAAVRYVQFRLPPAGRALLLDGAAEAALVVRHPRYEARAALNPEARRSLAEDLDPANGRSVAT